MGAGLGLLGLAVALTVNRTVGVLLMEMAAFTVSGIAVFLTLVRPPDARLPEERQHSEPPTQ